MEGEKVTYGDILQEIADLMGTETIVFFVGSGVSVPSPTKVPSGGMLRGQLLECVTDLVTRNDKSLQPTVERILNRLTNASGGDPQISFEEICLAVSRGAEDYVGFIETLDILLNGRASRLRLPNSIHRFLAASLALGHTVVTTNYDSFIEEAWYRTPKSRRPLRVYSDTQAFARLAREAEKDAPYRGSLLKVHGTFKEYEIDRASGTVTLRNNYPSVVTTLERVGRGLPPPQANALAGLLTRHPTVFMGYSASDIDIVFPVLARTLGEAKGEKPVFWIQYDSKDSRKVFDAGEIDAIRRSEEQKPLVQRDWQSFNVAVVLSNRNKSATKQVAWRIDANSVPLVEQLAAMLFFEIRSGKPVAVSVGEWGKVGGAWLRKKTIRHHLSILAELAGRSEALEEQERFCDRILSSRRIPLLPRLRACKMSAWASRRSNPNLALKRLEDAILLVDKYEKWPDPVFKSVEVAHLYSLRALIHLQQRRLISARRELDLILRNLPIDAEDWLAALGLKEGAGRNAILVDDPLEELAEIYNRAGNVLVTSVRDPATESTTLGNLTPEEQSRLLRGIGLARRALRISERTGAVRIRAQVFNILGLGLAKFGTPAALDEVQDLYDQVERAAGQLGWTRESAQHPRQIGLVYEKVALTRGGSQRDDWLEKAVKQFEEAIDNWMRYGGSAAAGDIRTAQWHMGRLLIKLKRYSAASTVLVDSLAKGGDWAQQTNVRAFLAIALTSGGTAAPLPEDRGQLEDLCNEICLEYETQLANPESLKEIQYGCSNALANLGSVKRVAVASGLATKTDPRGLQDKILGICRTDPWLVELANVLP